MNEPVPPSSDAPALAGAAGERWFAAHRRATLVLTLALAVLLRLVAFVELDAGPMLALHEWQESDMSFFHRWGEELAGGDWLGERPLHPYHSWHADDAAEHFASHPEDAAALAAEAAREGRGRAPGELLWERWYGGRRFHQEPLYPYLVGVTYALLGPDPRWVFAWQMLLGTLSVLLVRRLGRHLFGEAAGGVAGLAAALSGPLLTYDFLLLRATTLVFASLALAWLATRALERDGPRPWLATGVALGLALLLKTTFALFGAGLVLGLAWRRRGAAAKPFAALAAGALLALAPALARNALVGAPLGSLSSVGAVGVLSANAEDTAYRPELSLGSRHLPRIFAEDEDRGMASTYLAALRTHESLLDYAVALGARTLWVWHGFEIPNNASVDAFRDRSLALRAACVTFTLVAPLGLVGLWLARRRASAWTLAWMALANVPALVLFGILSRYRAPLFATLLPFAGLAAVRIAGWLRARELAKVALPAALVAVAVVANLVHPPHRVRVTDVLVPLRAVYQPRIQAALERGDVSAAAELAGEAARLEPGEVRRLGPSRPAASDRERTLAAAFAEVHATHARFLREAGHAAEAAKAEARARELAAAMGPMDTGG